ncbi:Myotubularin-like protein, partial [Globisporangium polare]
MEKDTKQHGAQPGNKNARPPNCIHYEKPLCFGLKTPAVVNVHKEVDVMAEEGRSRISHNIFGFSRDNPPRSEVTLFTFTVKKSDSMLEMLGSKKESIQLQVDIETRMLSIVSPHDNRESYSCAAVTARPHSRLGMQLKIQTGNASLNKKITFYSTEDRANFMQGLEEGRVIYKPNQMTRTQTEVPLEDSFIGTSETVSRTKFRESMMTDKFRLLPGEHILEHVQRVTNRVAMSQSDRAVQGVLKITTYRITFTP